MHNVENYNSVYVKITNFYFIYVHIGVYVISQSISMIWVTYWSNTTATVLSK